MAKKKLFTPEDFDKPMDKSWYQKFPPLLWIIGVVSVVAIVLCIFFCGGNQHKEETIEQRHIERITESTPTSGISVEGESKNVVPIQDESINQDSDESQVVLTEDTVTSNQKVKQRQVFTPSVTSQKVNVSDNIEQEAMNVIRGDYGNVPERRKRLGAKFQKIQNRVNELKREGVF